MIKSITVFGVVQGVGYRPFVARLAEELGVRGVVMNNGGIVEITAEASKQAMDQFIHRLKSRQPPGADVTRILCKPAPPCKFENFRIVQSVVTSGETPLIPPDLPICGECLKELAAPGDRRYRYPFISCVACGPRYSIINDLPYDRCNITMDDFPMCPACHEEYTTETRRRHAQTISCHDCGPQLIFQMDGKRYDREEALGKGMEMLRSGAVLALKGVGGYQFACLPGNEESVERLRRLKHRDKKPFAVMFPTLDSIREVCSVSAEEEKLLTSSARPIVLLNRIKDIFCGSLSSESRFLGAFLPYTGLHQLLTEACGPLVMTSGNFSNEPIIIDDAEMLAFQSDDFDGVLYHTRRIVTPLDDSVTRVSCGTVQMIRRSRGYVPTPLFLETRAEEPVLAMGGDLKACFCLMKDDRAYLSQYFGDMEEYEVSKVYRASLERMKRLFRMEPAVIACDLHPDYFTTRLAEELRKPVVRIQHHHAHIASVMAEHGLRSCIGTAFDGTGYGTDGCVWGGEFLLCKDTEYQRSAHLGYVTLCGGDRASKDAGLTALCYLQAAGIETQDSRNVYVKAVLENKINTFQCSSMGRLFDAVSAVLGIRSSNTYEGECAIALENAAAAAQSAGISPYPLDFEIRETGSGYMIDQIKMIKEIYTAVESRAEPGALALGFHFAVARMLADICRRIRSVSGENKAALSGGVFANLFLLQECRKLLGDGGFEVFLNSKVPCNDGGICLGQAWLCAQTAAKENERQ
jgi:[NiFe] hydrogenase maturation protein HypF